MTDSLDIDTLLTALDLAQDIDAAMDFGIGLLNNDYSIIDKKRYFGEAFGMNLEDEVEAVINLWAVGCMLEDDLSVPQKVSAVRGFLKDPAVRVEWINEWIRQVYNRKKAPEDMLDFIAIDLRNHPGIDEDLKKMLFEETWM